VEGQAHVVRHCRDGAKHEGLSVFVRAAEAGSLDHGQGTRAAPAAAAKRGSEEMRAGGGLTSSTERPDRHVTRRPSDRSNRDSDRAAMKNVRTPRAPEKRPQQRVERLKTPNSEEKETSRRRSPSE